VLTRAPGAQGDGAVLRCIDAAVLEMKRGEADLLYAPAAWAYGAPDCAAAGHAALAGARVEVELELVEFVRAKEAYDMDLREKAAAQAKKKGQGNALFRGGEWAAAVKRYERANQFALAASDLEKSGVAAAEKGEAEAAAKRLKLSCFLNMAACQLKLADGAAALKACQSALEIDGESVKALFRRGQAQLLLGELGPAKADLVDAARRDPKNKARRPAQGPRPGPPPAQHARVASVTGDPAGAGGAQAAAGGRQGEGEGAIRWHVPLRGVRFAERERE
jgi:FK506-binding protein 4/5